MSEHAQRVKKFNDLFMYAHLVLFDMLEKMAQPTTNMTAFGGSTVAGTADDNLASVTSLFKAFTALAQVCCAACSGWCVSHVITRQSRDVHRNTSAPSLENLCRQLYRKTSSRCWPPLPPLPPK